MESSNSPKEVPQRRASEFTRFVVVDPDGECFEVTPEDYSRCPVFSRQEPACRRLKQFVTNELSRREPNPGAAPKHIEYMRRQGLVNYCEVSEKGHHLWYPKGLLIQRLILDYAARLAREWGAFEMRNPLVIRGDHNAVGQLMGEFHERDYRVDGGRGVCYLRYASDPLAFPFMHKVRFSHKQSPLKVYEEALCFRNEQEGEVSGLKRVRAFTMTDMHAACATVEGAREEFEILCVKFADLMNAVIAKGRWVLGWEGTIAFFERNQEWLVGLGRRMGVPAFFKLMPEMSHYYAMKSEYQFITEDRANIQVSTVQWDVKDGERFDIGYTDADGARHPCPVIIHASSFGSIERTLCAILENIAIDARHGRSPVFPFWLAPTQVRVLTVSDASMAFAVELCGILSEAGIRVDIDDRADTVGKKIRNCEREWIPYAVVLGEKERVSGRVTVRSRAEGSHEEMSLERLRDGLIEECDGMPLRPLPLPVRVSARPAFCG
jgi:threonyl-tRNA synthetase